MNHDVRRNYVSLLLKILSRRAHGKGGTQSPDDGFGLYIGGAPFQIEHARWR